MSFEIKQGEFMQILHDGHWLTVSSVISEDDIHEIQLYDSMYPTVGTYMKKKIAVLA